ncbi:histidinol-phosphate transaminase [Corynebacterium macginleyi]|uniref:histidinol-phosphate transaminase n=1 Tax=Corynebacterium macginleyi TaxID=38290 RepID=UPI00190B6232|nr:histidinol-phosphate transaminase [Corynebacterium macginleyi]MBK4151196.1 histidinol-phosphate transaminase [Corynebacterium macginleyi]MBK4168203.1 histidinol-phosphate transaminase [Corynebacterium macginleyi]
MIRSDLHAIPSYAPGAHHDDALQLSSNEAAQPPLPEVTEAMVRAAAEANRYPDITATKLREELAQHLGVGFDQVAVGTGSSALCQQLVQITTVGGEEVIFPWRSFEAYPIFVQVVGARPIPVPLDADHRVDLAAIADKITADTRLIFVCNPNNPSGTTVTKAEFAEFMDVVPSDVLVVLDEAYIEYNRNADTPLGTELFGTYPNVVFLRTFSKAYGLAGVRVGYTFGPEEIIAALNKVAIPFSINSVAQAGARAALTAQDSLRERTEETCQQRERVEKELAEWGVPHSETNHVWLPAENIKKLGTPQELATRLAEHGVLVRAFNDGVRITITTEEETNALLRAWSDAIGG